MRKCIDIRDAATKNQVLKVKPFVNRKFHETYRNFRAFKYRTPIFLMGL